MTAKKTDAGHGFDAFKPFFAFDPTATWSEFAKAFGPYKLPGFDVETAIESQRKTIEAFAAANRVAIEGARAVVALQSKAFAAALDDAQTALKDVAGAKSAQERIAKQLDYVEHTVKNAQSNFAELSTLAAKSSGDAVAVLNQRAIDAVAETKAALRDAA
jgi:phasin family protein